MRVHLFAHVKMGIKMLHAALGRSTAAILARFALFISGIFLSISVAHAGGTPHLRFGRSPTHNDVLVMIWTGIVESGMSEEIRTAFDANKDSIRAVELKLELGRRLSCRGRTRHRRTANDQEDAYALHGRGSRKRVRFDVRFHLCPRAKAACCTGQPLALP